jgi:hypothetical protein
LWGYIKYFHPRVTSPEIDWDLVFATAAPQILAAQSDAEAAEAVRKMLLPLADPSTRLITSGDDPPSRPTVFTTKAQDGVTIASLLPAPNMQAVQQENLAERLSGAGAVVIDIRGERAIPLGSYLPISKAAIGPAFRFRVHSGYASPPMALNGYGFFRSSWEVWDAIGWTHRRSRSVRCSSSIAGRCFRQLSSRFRRPGQAQSFLKTR